MLIQIPVDELFAQITPGYEKALSREKVEHLLVEEFDISLETIQNSFITGNKYVYTANENSAIYNITLLEKNSKKDFNNGLYLTGKEFKLYCIKYFKNECSEWNKNQNSSRDLKFVNLKKTYDTNINNETINNYIRADKSLSNTALNVLLIIARVPFNQLIESETISIKNSEYKIIFQDYLKRQLNGDIINNLKPYFLSNYIGHPSEKKDFKITYCDQRDNDCTLNINLLISLPNENNTGSSILIRRGPIP